MTANAQWCIPTTALPYNNAMPGITHFVFNTIDRVSADLENFPNNSYVNSGLSTQVIRGNTYSISMTYTVDASICPDMNLRVWIDFNQDGYLDDIDETVIAANNQLPGTYTDSFTIPASAFLGLTRMRVTAKMTPNGGHILPSPCDDPPDPFGYHGEFEDYDVTIMDATGIQNPSAESGFLVISENGKFDFSFSLNESAKTSLEIFDITGRIVEEILPVQNLNAGKYSFEWNANEKGIKSGLYFVSMNQNNRKEIKRITVE